MEKGRIVKAFELDAIREFIANTSEQTKVYVGCDSNKRRKKARFVTVIVVHYEGRKGAKIFYQIEVAPRMSREKRLWQEVEESVKTAKEIVDAVGARELEVHLDLNPDSKYASSRLVSGAVGYVQSLQFTAQIKPAAWAASHVADHITKHDWSDRKSA